MLRLAVYRAPRDYTWEENWHLRWGLGETLPSLPNLRRVVHVLARRYGQALPPIAHLGRHTRSEYLASSGMGKTSRAYKTSNGLFWGSYGHHVAREAFLGTRMVV